MDRNVWQMRRILQYPSGIQVIGTNSLRLAASWLTYSFREQQVCKRYGEITMRTLCPASQAVAKVAGLGAIVLVLGVWLSGAAGAQTIKFQRLTIEQAENGFVVTGAVQGSGLNDVGIVESDRVAIYADVKGSANAKYGLLPQSMYIRPPAGAETSYTKGSGPGGTMTKAECYGTDIKSVSIASFKLRNEPVWRAYGGLTDWSKNAPDTVNSEFSGRIPLEYAGKTLRIRATLTHEWGGPYAWWPAFSFHHDIGYEGVLQAADVKTDQPHEIKITQGPSGRPNPVEFNATPDKLEIPVFCTIGARDTRDHAVRYEWECTDGQFDDPTKKDPIWTQPQTFASYMKTGYNVGITCKVTCTEDPAVNATASYIQKVSGAQMISGTYHRVYLEPNPASQAVDLGTNVEEPWAGLFVMITGPDGKQTSARTDGNGSFQVEVDAPGTYTVEVEDANIFSREYVVTVTVPNGQVGLQYITDDWKMYQFARVASGYKMMQAQGMLQGGGDYNQVNGLGGVVDIVNKLDWHKFLNQSSDKLLQQWKTKKWKYVAPGRNHGQVGAGLLNALSNSIDNSLNSTPAPSNPPNLVKTGGGVQFRDNGAFMQRSLQPNEAIDCGIGRFVQNSTVLYYRDDRGVVAYVLEGLVLEYAPGNSRPIAGAITDYKITHDIGAATPVVERFEWAEAEAVWATGKRPGGGSTPDVPTDGSVLKLSPAMDADVYEYAYLNWNRTNSGKVPTITAGYHPQGGEKRVYMRFELPALGSVNRATLKLYQYHFAGQHIHHLGVYRVASPWLEGEGVAHRGETEPTAAPGELSWVNQPGFEAAPAATFMPPDDANEWVEVDITALVNRWLAGEANYGLVLKVAALPTRNMPNTWYGFYSREYEDQAKRPVLELTPASTPTGGTNQPPVADDDDDGPVSGELPPQLSDPVIRRAGVCESVDDQNRPILRNSFPAGTQRIGIYLEWANAAPNTQIRIQWYQDGKALWDSRMVAEGTRRAVSYLRSGKSGTALQSGSYRAQVFRGDTPVANLTFTIGR
jgi:hypothetical protein